MSRSVLVLVVSLVVLAGNAIVYSQSPMINFQGKLLDDGGEAVNGTVSIKFSIYSSSTGGSALWTETQSVTVQNGIYTVLLGSITSIPSSVFNGDDRWLGIKVGSDAEMTPRRQIVSVGYALRADKANQADDADKLDGQDASAFANVSHDPDGRYYTEAELNTSDGSGPNTGSNRVHWDNLWGIPAGFADGTDDVGSDSSGISQVNAGTGITVTNPTGPTVTVAADIGTGAGQVAAGDHTHSGVYANIGHTHSGEEITSGTVGEAWIASAIARDSEIWPTVLANDGSGTGLDADMLDGQHASNFLSTANDWGRSGVAASLYEGTTALSAKYLGISAKAADADALDGHDTSYFALATHTHHSLDAADGSPEDALYVDNDGKTGIGTTSPVSKFHISKEGDALANEFSSAHGIQIQGSDHDMLLGVDTSRRAAYMQSVDHATGTSAIALNPRGGNVGIGTTIPAYKLDVAGSVNATTYYGDGSHLTGVSTGGLWTDSGSYIYANNATNVVVTDDNRVGVGNVSPEEKLHVTGGIRMDNNYLHLYGQQASGAASPAIRFLENGSSSYWTVNKRGSSYSGAPDLLHFSYYTGTTWNPVLNLKTDKNAFFEGYLGVNGWVNPSYPLHVQGDVGFTGTLQQGAVPWARLANVPSGLDDGDDILSEEQAEDYVGGMVTGNTETDITVTYQDSDGTLDFGVTDMRPTAGNDIDVSGTQVSVEDDLDVSIVRASGASGLRLYDDGSNSGLFVEDGGDVGIGTSSPGTKLHIEGAHVISRGLVYLKGIGDHCFLYVDTDAPAEKQVGFVMQKGGAVKWALYDPEGSDDFRIRNISDRLTIQSDGDVGIGTITPGYKLDVNGSVNATAYYGDGSYLTGIGGGQWTDAGSYIYANNANNVVVTDDSKVGIGITSPTQKLDVGGTILGALPLTDVDLVYNGDDNLFFALMVAGIPSTGKVYIKSFENRPYDELDDLTDWGPWRDYGTPDAASRLIAVSASISHNYTTGKVSALITARVSSGKVYLKSYENGYHDTLDDITYWGPWKDFTSPGM